MPECEKVYPAYEDVVSCQDRVYELSIELCKECGIDPTKRLLLFNNLINLIERVRADDAIVAWNKREMEGLL